MVSISSFMKAHGIWEPCSGHLSPLGQYASLLPCLMMESLQQEKQNLWRVFEGHCTKWVSSSLPRQFVHFRSGVPSAVSSAPSLAPLLELDTWSGRLPSLCTILKSFELVATAELPSLPLTGCC